MTIPFVPSILIQSLTAIRNRIGAIGWAAGLFLGFSIVSANASEEPLPFASALEAMESCKQIVRDRGANFEAPGEPGWQESQIREGPDGRFFMIPFEEKKLFLILRVQKDRSKQLYNRCIVAVDGSFGHEWDKATGLDIDEELFKSFEEWSRQQIDNGIYREFKGPTKLADTVIRTTILIDCDPQDRPILIRGALDISISGRGNIHVLDLPEPHEKCLET